MLVGHGYFDHAGDLGYVAGRSGTVVVGSAEICDVAVGGAAREQAGADFVCALTSTAETPATRTAQSLSPTGLVVTGSGRHRRRRAYLVVWRSEDPFDGHEDQIGTAPSEPA